MELLLVVAGVFVVLVIVAMVKGSKPVVPVPDTRDGFEHAAARNAKLRDSAFASAAATRRVDDEWSEPVTAITINPAVLRSHSLQDLPSIRTRIRGSFAWVTEPEREVYSAERYLLVREPTNPHDRNAIAIYGNGRKVGHVSAAKASAIAPLLDALPFDAYSVGGTRISDSSIKMWVDLPRIPELRKHLREL